MARLQEARAQGQQHAAIQRAARPAARFARGLLFEIIGAAGTLRGPKCTKSYGMSENPGKEQEEFQVTGRRQRAHPLPERTLSHLRSCSGKRVTLCAAVTLVYVLAFVPLYQLSGRLAVAAGDPARHGSQSFDVVWLHRGRDADPAECFSSAPGWRNERVVVHRTVFLARPSHVHSRVSRSVV